MNSPWPVTFRGPTNRSPTPVEDRGDSDIKFKIDYYVETDGCLFLMRYVSYLHRNRGYKVCRLSVCPSICLPAYLPACLYVCLSVRPSVCLPACLSICLSVCLSVQDASNLRQLNEFGWNFAQRWRYVPDCVSHFDGDHPRGPAGRAKVYNWGRYCISFALTNFILLVRLYRLSVIDKVLTTSRPSYLNNLISVQPLRSTRSSSVVTLSCRPSISSLKITDRSFIISSL